MYIGDAILCSFGLCTFVLVIVTAIRFKNLTAGGNTINYNPWSLVMTSTFIISFIINQIVYMFLQFQIQSIAQKGTFSSNDFEDTVDTLNVIFMVSIILRSTMNICLTILIVCLYRNIDQFNPESKKV